MKKIRNGMTFGVLVLIVFITLFPVYYTVSHSLKGERLITTTYQDREKTALDKAFIKPFFIDVAQYEAVLFKTPEFIKLFWNSVKIVVPIVVLQLILGVIAAYGFSKLKFKGSQILFFAYIIVMLMPFQVTVVPNYMILNGFKLLDTLRALILPGVFGTFGTFFLKQYMEGIEESLLEQARIEGANEVQILVTMIAPICKPVIASTAVLLFVDYWNMVEQPMIFLSSQTKFPLSLYLSQITQSNLGIGFACSVVYMILPLLIVIYTQNDLIEGMSINNLK